MSMEEETIHIPVMVDEVLRCLDPRPGDCVVDCTLGTGGHARAIAGRLSSRGQIIGLDRDGRSLHLAEKRLKALSVPVKLFKGDFRDIDVIVARAGYKKVDVILFDLGLSSFQLDRPDRGFSLREQGPLDMRMDQDGFITAFDLVNSLSEREIVYILKNYGEERWHHRIAHYIVRHRERRPIESTHDLTEIVLQAIPQRYQRSRIHPATRTFQAFRIAVNRELEALDLGLDKAVALLKEGGRIGVIAFHSLEDRMVKQRFRHLIQQGTLRTITKKPLRPDPRELQSNPRSRSARFRAAERIS